MLTLVDLGRQLLECAKNGDTESVRQLMTNGAPFTTDWLGTSPLHLAAQHGHLNTCEVLIRAGISRDARTKVDKTPMHMAAQEGHIDIIELLMRNGADIDAKDMLKMTPLHWAVERGHTRVIEYLLRHGADCSCLSKFDKSPLDVAADNGRPDLLKLLQSAEELRETQRAVMWNSDEPNEVVPSAQRQEEVKTSSELAAGSKKPLVTPVNLNEIKAHFEALGEKTSVRPVLMRADTARCVSKGRPSKAKSGGEAGDNVLSAFASLAEATSTETTETATATDTLQWLQTHGITMVQSDESTVVESAIESGQTVALTDAGKLALDLMKNQGKDGSSSTVGGGGSKVVIQGKPAPRKMFTIVSGSGQTNLGAGSSKPILLAVTSNGVHPVGSTDAFSPTTKKRKMEVRSEYTSEGSDHEDLQKQLEEAQRRAEEYREQLRQKESEAEEYRRRLETITAQSETSVL